MNQQNGKANPEIPYLNHHEFLNGVQLYVDLPEFTQSLIVYGAKSVAKSGGLQFKMQKWREDGHLVIDINLKPLRGRTPSLKAFFVMQC
eukprot:TRINITY_DN13724_c0_g1_i1.p1 TRINITY_DN13724_c0_g1~~TRINITY_DN13724_c0_g1_i1.p1  ORF type:complete len:89 (-),score=9.57 TRINITY_DN13724_c0_g1_i1:18-284(-)